MLGDLEVAFGLGLGGLGLGRQQLRAEVLTGGDLTELQAFQGRPLQLLSQLELKPGQVVQGSALPKPVIGPSSRNGKYCTLSVGYP